MLKTFLAAAFALSVAGCTTTPTAPPELDLPPPTLSDATAAVLPRWWTAFGDPRLDALIDEALANNLDLRAALARIEQARARVTLSQADLFPTADLSVGANRTSRSAISRPSTIVSATFTAVKTSVRTSVSQNTWSESTER